MYFYINDLYYVNLSKATWSFKWCLLFFAVVIDQFCVFCKSAWQILQLFDWNSSSRVTLNYSWWNAPFAVITRFCHFYRNFEQWNNESVCAVWCDGASAERNTSDAGRRSVVLNTTSFIQRFNQLSVGSNLWIYTNLWWIKTKIIWQWINCFSNKSQKVLWRANTCLLFSSKDNAYFSFSWTFGHLRTIVHSLKRLC